jgi:hypothetical protein
MNIVWQIWVKIKQLGGPAGAKLQPSRAWSKVDLRPDPGHREVWHWQDRGYLL